MRRDGLANVRVDPVMVPHWVRGVESAEIVCTLSASAGHGGARGQCRYGTAVGLEAEAIVVGSFDELERQSAHVKGKIVVFSVPFPTDRNPIAAYLDAVAVPGQRCVEGCRARAPSPRSVRSIRPWRRIGLLIPVRCGTPPTHRAFLQRRFPRRTPTCFNGCRLAASVASSA